MLKKKNSFLKAISFLLAVIVFMGIFITPINAKKGDTDSKIKSTKEKLDRKREESQGLSEEISKLDMEMEKVAEEIDEALSKVKKIEEDIEVTKGELEEAENNLKEKTDLFNQRIRVMYMNGNTGYLELLLSSENIKDFLAKKDMLQSIVEYDKDLMEYMKEQRDIIDSRKEKLEVQKVNMEKSKEKLENKREELNKKNEEKKEIMNKIESDINALEREHDNLVAEAKRYEAEIIKMQSKNTTYSGTTNNVSRGTASSNSGTSSSSSGKVSSSRGGGGMAWPVAGGGRVTSPFGYRNHPVLNRPKLHTGIDIGAGAGTSVLAAQSGRVIHSGWLGSYGKVIMIDHGGGIVTLYAHNSSLLVSNGQSVSKGQVVAKVGSTGMSTGPHLHFEVRQNGRFVNPMSWL